MFAFDMCLLRNYPLSVVEEVNFDKYESVARLKNNRLTTKLQTFFE